MQSQIWAARLTTALTGLAMLIIVSSAGCARQPVRQPGPPASPPASPQATTSPQPAASRLLPTAGPGVPNGRLASIYIAVLKRYLTTSDNSFSSTHRFAIAYVFTIADPAAASPTDEPAVTAVISEADQAAIVAGLADVGPVEFVAKRDGVVEQVDQCQRVRGDGVLIQLAPPVGTDHRVEVGINGFVACLAATWFTYVVEGYGTSWTVTGITGPVAIA